MSLDRVYREIPLEERVCEGCGEPIQRNVAMLDGKLYHWGCLKRSKAKPTHLCLDCWSYLTGKGLTKVDWGDGSSTKACGNCGSTNLKRLRRWREY